MNKKYIHLIFLAIILLLQSCATKKHSEIIYSEFENYNGYLRKANSKSRIDSLLSKNNLSAVHFKYNSKNELTNIKSKLDNRVYGHSFTFGNDGIIGNYVFINENGQHFSYEVKKEFMDDRYYEAGTPFVDFMQNEGGESNETKKYSILLSTFPRRVLKIFSSIDGVKYSAVKLYQSKVMPLLSEADLIFDQGVKMIFIRIEAEKMMFPLNGLSDSKVFLDTLRIER